MGARWLAALGLAAIAACTADYGLLTDGDVASSAASGSAGASSSSSTSGEAGGPASGGGSMAPASASSAGSGGAGAAGGAGPGGAGGSPPLECWGPGSVCCGRSTPCAIDTEECCVTEQDDAEDGVCVPKGRCGEIPFQCDATEDCPGATCCSTLSNGSIQQVVCQQDCQLPGYPGQDGAYPICNWAGDKVCPSGLECNDAPDDAGYGYCWYPDS